MEKKFLIISVLITLGAVAFLSGYLLMPQNNLDEQSGAFLDRFNGNTDADLSGDRPGKVLPLSSRKFISFISLNERIVAVDKSGNIVEIDINNLAERVLAVLKHSNITEVIMSPSGNSLVYSFYDSGNVKKYVYLDFKKGETEILNEFKSGSFSPNSDQLAYLTNKEGGGELLISKGSDILKRVLKTRIDNGVVSWSKNISIIAYDKDGYGDLFALKEGSKFNKIISYKLDLGVNWSPSGEKLIYSAKNNGHSDYLLYKDVGKNIEDVDLSTETNVQKCAWLEESSIVCGIAGQTKSKDEFYKINLADGSKTLISSPGISIITKEISVSRSIDYIIVLNSTDNGLYALKTKEPL